MTSGSKEKKRRKEEERTESKYFLKGTQFEKQQFITTFF
jgi:hypothetical protein